MWNRALKASLVLVFCALAAHPPVAEAKSLYGTFTEIYSADLLELRHDAGTYAVRIYGVDAPDAGEPFALEARLLTRALVTGKECRVRIEGRNERGEMVAIVLADGQDVGLALVRAGLAKRVPDVHYKLTSNDQPDALVAAEDEARSALRGLWKGASPNLDTKAGSVVPEAAAAVRGGGTQDINTSQKSGADNECAVAQDPSDPDRLFKSCNTSSAGLFAARSTDGGETWTYPDATDKTIADGDAGQGTSACCDPTLAWDSFGNLYVTYLNSAASAVVTLLSTDGGATFSPLATFSGSVDQPTVVAADVPGGVGVWIVWNQSGSMVARGALATGLGTVGTFSATQTAPSTSGCSFGDIAVAPSGVVVQVCEQPSGGQGPANIRLNIDADGLGAGGFAAVSTATSTNVGGFDFIPAQNNRSVDAEAGLAYDANPSSPQFGRLYLVYSEEVVAEAHDLETMVRFSDDDGVSWSAPIRVNDDATTTSQFMPKIATDPATGNIGVCWHDARNSGTNTAMEIFCSTALPSATPTFSSNVVVSDAASTSTGGGVEFGDYMGLAFKGGVVHPVWADTSNSTGDNPNGTANFDAYTDQLLVGELVFADGFETGDASNWTLCSGACPP